MLVKTKTDKPTPKRDLFVRSLKATITLSMLLLIYNDILGGAVKYYTSTSSLLFLSFVPTLFAGAVLAFYFGTHLMVLRIHIKVGLFFFIFILNAIYALAVGRIPEAVGFAFYIWQPFFIGLLVVTFRLQDEFRKQAVIWWIIATVGVLLNSQIKFPWIGESYQVMGQTVQTARDWTAIGYDRLAGFSRASFAAANQIALFCMVILSMRISVLRKLIVWALSMVAVYLTTTKITLFLMIIGPILIGIIDFFQYKAGAEKIPSKNTIRLATSMTTTLAAIMVFLPIFSITSGGVQTSSQVIGFLSLNSLFDRMGRMWPEAWELIFGQANPIIMIFGRGLGGIGTPQIFYEALYKNSADNLFVYLYITFGLVSVIFIRYLIVNIKKWAIHGKEDFLTYFALTICVLIIGTTANVVENATSLFALGLLIGKSSSKEKSVHPTPTQPNIVR